MASKSWFLWKIWNCCYLKCQKHFFNGYILKLGNILIKVKKSASVVLPSQNSWNIFQMEITRVLWHPWEPWGHQSSGVICIWKIYHLFCDSCAALADFFTFIKMLPNVSFIRMVIKKVFLSVSIATISNFLQKCTLWMHNYETSQEKIGQCDF